MIADAELLHLIRDIYASVVEPEGWQFALEALNRAFVSDHIYLFSRNGGALAFGAVTGIDPGAGSGHATARGQDLWRPIDRKIPVGRAVLQSEVIADAEYEVSDFYNELVRPLGGFYGLNVKQLTTDASFHMALCRPRRAGAYDDGDAARLNVLLPHLTTAFELHSRFQTHIQQRSGLTVLLGAMRAGALLCDDAGTIILINARAQTLLEENRGILIADGKIALSNPDRTRKLRNAIEAVGRGSIASFRMAEIRPALPQLIVKILPAASLPGQDSRERAQVALFFEESGSARTDADRVLMDMFNLTKREAQIANLIAKGHSPDEIGKQFGIAVNTVRWNLKSIYGKTGTTSQLSLAVLIADHL